MEYVGDRLLEHIRVELLGEWEREWEGGSGEDGGKAEEECFLHRYALIKAAGKEYLREAQLQLILKPIADWLLRRFGSLVNCQMQLLQVLKHLRSMSLGRGYGGGNIFDLLSQLEVDLTGWDFSNLAIWQADLSDINLHGVNFADADLSKSVFTQSFGDIVAIAFHPNGQILANGSLDHTVKLWNVRNGRCLSTLRDHHNGFSSVAFSPDGEFLVSGSTDHTVRLWDVETGDCIRVLTHPVPS